MDDLGKLAMNFSVLSYQTFAREKMTTL